MPPIHSGRFMRPIFCRDSERWLPHTSVGGHERKRCMLNLADLGFEPADTKTIETDEPAQDGPAGLVPIEPGSVVAKTLYHVWSGQPVTIVDSPPGAGKSTLVATVSQHLAAGSTLSVRIAAPTRDAVRALAQRIDQITETGAV